MAQINIDELPIVPSGDVRSTSVLILNTTDSNGQTYTGQMAVPDFMAAISGGASQVKVATLVIPSAQVLTLNGTPVDFDITVPTGYYVQPVSAPVLKASYNSAAYATNTTLQVFLASADPMFEQDVLGFTDDVFQPIETNYTASRVLAINQVPYVTVATGNPTAGDSDITITLTYLLIPA